METVMYNEGRIHQRISYREKINIFQYYNNNGSLIKLTKAMEMVIIDISIGGIGGISNEMLEYGSVIEFTLYLEKIPYPVLAKIVWVDNNVRYYKYGLEIIGHNNMMFRHLKEFTLS